MSELFEEHSWIGEFFQENNYEHRFTGKLSYHPEKGVLLDYTYTSVVQLSSVTHLHGVMANGDKCTLIGQFSPESAGLTLKDGINTRSGKAGFLAIVFGEFISGSTQFNTVDFTLTGLQEFFFPKGYKDLVKYSNKPLISINTKYGKLSVGNNAKFGSLAKDVSSQIYTRNAEAQQKLAEAFTKIESEHSDAHFMLKQDISYSIKLESESGADIETFYDHITDIANLFALLVSSPVYPDRIKFIVGSGVDKKSLVFYPSMSLEKRVIELSLQERTNFYMPIKNSNVDLESVLSNWLDSPKNFSTLISRLQNETGYRSVHEVHGELVLYGTQFEAISYDEGAKSQKYIYPLKTYASPEISNSINTIFTKVGCTDAGTGISSLRNEIAHVGRPKELIPKLSMRELVDISLYMQLTIIGKVLSELDIPDDVIFNYQNRYIAN